MEREQMEEPVLEVCFFACDDLITTSTGNSNDLDEEQPLI